MGSTRIVPLSPEVGLLKTCPSCKRTLDTTLDNWYQRLAWRNLPIGEDQEGEITLGRVQVSIPSIYCKDCSRSKARQTMRNRRAIDKLPEEEQITLQAATRGPCACCGVNRNRRVVLEWRENRIIVCTLCREKLETCDFSLLTAKRLWNALRTHIADEMALDELVAVRAPGRRRQWHEENPNVGADAPEHMECLWSEKAWKPVVKWLAKQSLSTNPT